MFAKQSYWPKPSRAFFQTWAFAGFFSFPMIGSLLFTRRMLIGWLQVA